jgi:hypothetical protein
MAVEDGGKEVIRLWKEDSVCAAVKVRLINPLPEYD